VGHAVVAAPPPDGGSVIEQWYPQRRADQNCLARLARFR
jgi:hypothetical protein